MSERDSRVGDVPVTCKLDEADLKRRRRGAIVETLRDALVEVEEREGGFEFAFEGTDEALRAVATFVEREADCCSFARYRIEVPQGFETVRLSFDGPDGTTDALVEPFAEALGLDIRAR